MYFTHLHVHSHYSLLDGLTKPEELLKEAKKMGLDALALTDHGVMYGAIEFYTKAKELGIKPIIGCEFYLAPRSLYDKVAKIDSQLYHLTVLAKNKTGYQNLMKLVTVGELDGFYYKPRIDKETLKKFKEGLIVLSGCPRGEIPCTIFNGNYKKAKELALDYLESLGKENFYLELQHHPELDEQKIINEGLLKISEELGVPAVITCDTHYLKKEEKKVQDVLLAVQTNAQLDDEDRLTMQKTDLHLKSFEEVLSDFKDYPQLFENIKKIVDDCNLELDLSKIVLPYFDVPGGEDSYRHLEKLAQENFEKFYSPDNKEAKERFEYELGVIKKTGFSDYFLVIHDIIQYAKNNGILTNTRGSAAGSLVAYILGITNIDPIKYNLYFERFLNPERIQPPDIDVDVADDRREELIQYITEKYGKENVAQICTFGIMKSRLAVRDVTRVMGCPYALGDQIARLIPFNVDLNTALSTIPELKQLYNTNTNARDVIDMAVHLEGVARHASTHAAGVIISREPLVNYVPLQYSSRSEKEIISQYDMYSLEKIGLLKIDILGLANLTIIKNTLRIIKKVYGDEIDLDKADYEDKKVYQLLSDGNTVGVFQVESSGMRRYLQELRPTKFEDISAILALYRPGPMKLIPQFIRRKQGKEKIAYFHPKLKSILENTYGVCLYQEQLMKIAHDLAGYSMSEADVLRKAVGKKIKSLLNAQKEKLIDGMMKNNITKSIAEKIWAWVEPFARYGFNKGHSASYARITYQTAWLKANYPNAFMAALLTSDYGNLDRIAIEVSECEKMGIKVLPPSVNYSFAEFGINQENGNILFGLAAIKNVGLGVAGIIQEERQKNGIYKNFNDFIKRIPRQVLNKKTLESLIKAGAFDCFGSRELMADHLEEISDLIYRFNNNHNNQQMFLFKESETEDILENLKAKYSEPPIDKPRRLNWEKEYIGLYLTSHPLDDYKNILEKINDRGIGVPVSRLNQQHLGKKIKACGFVSRIQKIITKTGKPMVFAKLADYQNSIELVLYPTVLANYFSLLSEDKVILVEGKLDRRNGNLQIIGEKMEEIKIMEA